MLTLWDMFKGVSEEARAEFNDQQRNVANVHARYTTACSTTTLRVQAWHGCWQPIFSTVIL